MKQYDPDEYLRFIVRSIGGRYTINWEKYTIICLKYTISYFTIIKIFDFSYKKA